MKLGKLDKIFEQQEQMIKVKLKSDPVKKDKSYEGFLVNETPKAELKMEGLLSTIGKAQSWLANKNAKLKQLSTGDLTSLGGNKKKKKSKQKVKPKLS